MSRISKQQHAGAAPSGSSPDGLERARGSLQRHLAIGLVLIAVLVLGAGGWAVTANLAGAVVAPGMLVVDSNVKKVQHPTGGIVGEVRVRDGDQVSSGDVLVRLDDTVTRANLAVVSKELDALAARRARLQAERDGAPAPVFPTEITARSVEPTVREIVDGEQRLFEMRRAAREGQKAQLAERITQLRKEISGTLSQERANEAEIKLAHRELEGVRKLWDERLISVPELVSVERDVTRLEGARGQLSGTVARLRGQISEVSLQVAQIDRDLGTEVGQELRDTEQRIGELIESRIAAEDLLLRVDIRAPQSGTVHQSTVHTVGGVIPAGEAIMLIVPEADALAVELRVRPQDIDQIALGGTARVRFSAFNQRTTPELTGTVNRVSADTSRDPVTGAEFYTVRIAVPQVEMSRLGDIKLVPGMPTEGFVQTGTRSVLSYVLKPFRDQMARAFREH